MRAFPPRRRGVLLPLNDRKTAAAGVAMYTATKGWVVRLQLLVYWFVSRFGARLLPGPTVHWQPPCTSDEWAALVVQWQAALGPLTGIAVYQRRQSSRAGLTFVTMRRGRAVAVVKLRADGGPLATEQRALAAVAGVGSHLFRAPNPLGSGQCGALTWTAQECVFRRPHRPVLDAPDALFDEVSRALQPVVGDPSNARESPPHHGASSPAHGDLTPWNLRMDESGRVWLFDWEDVGLAPAGSDRTYFRVTAAAMTGGSVPPDLPSAAVAHWRRVVQERLAGLPEDAELGCTLLRLLAQASRAPVAG